MSFGEYAALHLERAGGTDAIGGEEITTLRDELIAAGFHERMTRLEDRIEFVREICRKFESGESSAIEALRKDIADLKSMFLKVIVGALEKK